MHSNISHGGISLSWLSVWPSGRENNTFLQVCYATTNMSCFSRSKGAFDSLHPSWLVAVALMGECPNSDGQELDLTKLGTKSGGKITKNSQLLELTKVFFLASCCIMQNCCLHGRVVQLAFGLLNHQLGLSSLQQLNVKSGCHPWA